MKTSVESSHNPFTAIQRITVTIRKQEKSSCVNARGIPPAVQQVLCGEDTYPSERVPTLARGYLPWPGGTYLGWQGYLPSPAGVPTLARGYLPWLGSNLPWWGEGQLPWLGVPILVRTVTYLGRHSYLPWPAGVPTLVRGYLPWLGITYLGGVYLPWPRWVPPSGVNRWTPVKTVEFFRIEFYRIYRIYRICRILFLVIFILKITKSSFPKISK